MEKQMERTNLLYGKGATPSMGLSQFRGGVTHTLYDHLENPMRGYGFTRDQRQERAFGEYAGGIKPRFDVDQREKKASALVELEGDGMCGGNPFRVYRSASDHFEKADTVRKGGLRTGKYEGEGQFHGETVGEYRKRMMRKEWETLKEYQERVRKDETDTRRRGLHSSGLLDVVEKPRFERVSKEDIVDMEEKRDKEVSMKGKGIPTTKAGLLKMLDELRTHGDDPEIDEHYHALKSHKGKLKGSGVFSKVFDFFHSIFNPGLPTLRKPDPYPSDPPPRRDTPPPRAPPPPPMAPSDADAEFLAQYGIRTRADFRKWSLRNHPDKGGDVALFQRIASVADKVFKGQGKYRVGGRKGCVDGRSSRAEIVKKVMAERGLSMIEASKVVKNEGLYKGGMSDKGRILYKPAVMRPEDYIYNKPSVMRGDILNKPAVMRGEEDLAELARLSKRRGGARKGKEELTDKVADEARLGRRTKIDEAMEVIQTLLDRGVPLGAVRRTVTLSHGKYPTDEALVRLGLISRD